MNSPANCIDHTLLKADATEEEIGLLCEEAVEYGFASVCIPPLFVPFASRVLYGSEVAVGTVVGFPLGFQTTQSKAFEASRAVDCGATEVDMVISLGLARTADFSGVEKDIRGVVDALERHLLVKVIIECCLFDDEVKKTLAQIVADSGAAYVKTSTGFSASGATVDDVRLLSDAVSGKALVKASGGIRDLPTCQAMLSSGASRIGTSSGVQIVDQWRASAGLSCL